MSHNPNRPQLSRRNFLVSSVGSAFVLSLNLHSALLQAAPSQEDPAPSPPDAFIKIASDGQVTVTIKHIEFGQGTYTGLATLVAEELDAPWDKVMCVHAEADTRRYANLHWGVQGTGGSSSIANSFSQMRQAGATARAMLVAAAAQKWKVPENEIGVQAGVVSHKKSGRKAGFGELATLAAAQPVPDKVTLKSPEQFSLIGKMIPRKDTGKTDGSATFTQDIQLPNMLTAVVLHPPKFGAKLRSFDDKTARKHTGVKDIIRLPNAIAVLADNFWQAKSARDLLQAKWDESATINKSSDDLFREYAELAKTPGAVAAKTGDVDSAFKQADKIVESHYAFPYLAHATMEPMNCVVQINWDKNTAKPLGAELWFGCQLPTADQGAVAATLGLEPGQVKINTVFAGGSFGRRGNAHSDYVVEAVLIAQQFGKSTPIKLVWTREDDTLAGYYRPMYYHKLTAGLDKKGKIIAWQHRIVGQSIFKGLPQAAFMIQNGIDGSSVEGAVNLPYAIANTRVELHSTENPVPVLWWRSVGSTHTAYATEAFIDQIAKEAGRDPLQYRFDMLGSDPRYRGVLQLAAKQAGFAKKKLNKNHHLGLAVHKSFNTYVAQVVEISKSAAGYKVEKVVCAVDCGIAVNPDIVKAQMEGGIGYGLSPAMMSQITLDQGKVVESNFHNYQVIRMKDMPEIEVYIVPSAEPPSGVGEPSTPVIAPALANALLAAGEEPQQALPMKVQFV